MGSIWADVLGISLLYEQGGVWRDLIRSYDMEHGQDKVSHTHVVKASGVASILVIWIDEYNSMSICGIILQVVVLFVRCIYASFPSIDANI
jgi:hypothetical protein